MPKNSKYQDFSKEELIREIQKLKKRNKYGIVWEEKLEKLVEECKEKLPVLKEVKSKKIQLDKNNSFNFIIEGDNYHTLSVLNYTHNKAIDVIYIDPPYNIGHGEFIYNAKLVDKNDAYRHSKWLSFMRKRLKLAKKLLNKSGVIFISIDDNEISQLKLLCDDIFFEKNYLGPIIVQSNPRGSQASTHLAEVHEYVLVYAKSAENCEIKGFKKDIDIASEYPEIHSDGRHYRPLGLRQRGGEWRREQRPNLFYPFYINPKDSTVSLEKTKSHYIESLPKRPSGEEGRWTWSPETAKKNLWMLVGKKVKRKNQENFYDIFRIDFYKDEEGIESLSKPRTIWIDKELNYQNGRAELKEIFDGEDVFEYPKPKYLMKKLISMTNNKTGTILDFFAGTGTTGHAVLELNHEDGGNRKFILSTNNENNICTDICYPRIQRVINGYKFEGKEKEVLFEKRITFTDLKKADEILEQIEQLIEKNKKSYDEIRKELNNGILKIYGIKNIKAFRKALEGNLKYFKTDFVDSDPIDKNKRKLTEKATEMLCIKEDTFIQVSNEDDIKIFKNDDHYTGIIFDQLAIPKFKDKISNINEFFSVYIFSLTDDTFEDEFEDIKDRVKITPIPESILKVYRRIFK